ncbi:MAG: acyltransferase [Pseudomonadota bacterium]|nr:acyltransferase [Pseudomonadota bacterium]
MNAETNDITSPGSRMLFPAARRWIDSIMRGVTVEDALARRVDNFLALRIVAASMVIYGHASTIAPAVKGPDIFVRSGWGIYSGDIAVDIFFLISGFLVTGSYIRQKNLYAFAKARFLRVYPAYVLNVVGLALVYGLLFTSLPKAAYLQQADVWNYITTNLKMSSSMAWSLPGVFEHGIRTSTINGSQWTLPAEVRMYVLLGVMATLGLLTSARVTTAVLGALLVLGVLRPELFPLHQDWFRLAAYFSVGVLVYMHRSRLHVRLEWIVALVLLAILTRHLAIYPMAFALALGGVVLGLAYLTPPLRWLARFGDPSYGVYLWGWPCQQAVAHLLPGAGVVLHVSLALAIALGLGYASWTVLEKQALRWK